MIATHQEEYHALERESSNFLLEHDSRRILGRYEEAAYDALQAGRGRACECGCRLVAAHRFSRGSRASRIPSPSRLKPKTVRTRAKPGKIS